MKKKKLQRICNIISILLIIAFVIKTIVNYFQYDVMVNSAPFYVWIIFNALFLLIPALLVFIIGCVIDKNSRHTFRKES